MSNFLNSIIMNFFSSCTTSRTPMSVNRHFNKNLHSILKRSKFFQDNVFQTGEAYVNMHLDTYLLSLTCCTTYKYKEIGDSVSFIFLNCFLTPTFSIEPKLILKAKRAALTCPFFHFG